MKDKMIFVRLNSTEPRKSVLIYKILETSIKIAEHPILPLQLHAELLVVRLGN